MAVRAYFAIRSNSHGKMSFCEIKKTFHDFKAYKPKGTVGNTATLPTHPKRQLYISLKIMPPMIRGPMWPKGVSYMTPGLQGSYMAVQPKLVYLLKTNIYVVIYLYVLLITYRKFSDPCYFLECADAVVADMPRHDIT